MTRISKTTPEGAVLKVLPETKKFAFALKQAKRKDKDIEWREVWQAVAWSYANFRQVSLILSEIAAENEEKFHRGVWW